MATHKTLQDTFWTRFRDMVRGLLLYGSFNWRRASDGLKPPKLTPQQRRMAMPPKNLEVIKPRENPQAALIKTLPKKTAPKVWDVTAGAIVSDPLLPSHESPTSVRHLKTALPSEDEPAAPLHAGTPADMDETVIVRRRKRHHRHGAAKRAPRSSISLGNEDKPGLLARWFGTK